MDTHYNALKATFLKLSLARDAGTRSRICVKSRAKRRFNRHRDFAFGAGYLASRIWSRLISMPGMHCGKLALLICQRLDAYFTSWRERFDLFHAQRPFLQMPDARVDPKSLIHLIHPMGNTGTLFSHASDGARIEFSAAEAARNLLAARCFRTAGLGPSIDRRRVSFSDSTFARGVIFWARGETLFETLLLNLVQYPDEQTMRHTGRDAPAWEMDNPFEQRESPYGYLDYLTWSNNRVQLIPEASG